MCAQREVPSVLEPLAQPASLFWRSVPPAQPGAAALMPVDRMIPQPPCLPAVSLPRAPSGASLGRRGRSWIGVELVLGEGPGGEKAKRCSGLGGASWLEPQLRLRSLPVWTTQAPEAGVHTSHS